MKRQMKTGAHLQQHRDVRDDLPDLLLVREPRVFCDGCNHSNASEHRMAFDLGSFLGQKAHHVVSCERKATHWRVEVVGVSSVLRARSWLQPPARYGRTRLVPNAAL